MIILFLIISTLINLFIFVAHFWLSLNNPLTDILASIPNLFWGVGYFILNFIFNFFTKNKITTILKVQSFVLFVIYISAYIFWPLNIFTPQTSYQLFRLNKTNVIICDQNTKKVQALRSSEFWETLKMNKCDIIILQEVLNSDYYKNYIKNKLQNFFNTPFSVITFNEFVIASRYPSKLEQISTNNGFLVGIINVPNQKIRIINTHIWTPLEPRTPNIDPFLEYPIPPYQVRQVQTQELIQYLQMHLNDMTPTIIIGDFNMLPTNSFLTSTLKKYKYKRIKKSLFITPTYSNTFPIIEIDHTLTNYPALIKQRTTLLNEFSDHAMQIIYLNIPK